MNLSKNPVVSEEFAYHRAGYSYLEAINTHTSDFLSLDQIFPSIYLTLEWLNQHPAPENQGLLLNLIFALNEYFISRSLHQLLLDYGSTLVDFSKNDSETYLQLLLLIFQANFMAGNWEEARNNINQTILFAEKHNSSNLGQVYRALGMFQFNRGDYSPGLASFSKAKELFLKRDDSNGYYSVIGQEAAFYIDHDQYEKADSLYAQVEQYETLQFGKPSSHTLSMIGVASRRLQRYAKAESYLIELAQVGNENRSTREIALALHHLAWVYEDQNHLDSAWELAIANKQLFLEAGDPRGVSDADEQIGDIAFKRKDYKVSIDHLKKAIQYRKSIGNKVGIASASRRLAKAYLANKQYLKSFLTLIISAATYARLGMLNRKRIRRWLGLK